jgi:acid phosphatase
MRRLLLAVLLLAGCATSKPSTPQCNTGDPLINASLWVQTSAEYKASALQTYSTAQRMLDSAMRDVNGPAAVILDLDETAIDNSAFESRMVKKGISYVPADWRTWIGETRAVAVPGVVEFLNYAKSRGVTPFYVTNRKIEEEADTRLNLDKLGFPLSATEDTILTRGERPEWASNDKTGRRNYIASRYRILMLLGDDLNDFVDAYDANIEQRDALVTANRDKWGTSWFVLPNPMYGSWERAITAGKEGCEHLQRKMNALRQ